jgi:hypothetical protein
MVERTVHRTAGRRAEALAFLLLILLVIAPTAAADGSASLTISGTVLPSNGLAADFAATPRSGMAPLAVRFTDRSTENPTSWGWDLDGDGLADSTVKNPAFVYHRAGSYTVTLTISKAAGTDAETKPGYITVSEPGALARVRSLQTYVDAMPAGGLVRWFLSIHLQLAERTFSRGNERAAANQMQAFTNRVILFERFRLISGEQAGFMREEAQIIRELLRG